MNLKDLIPWRKKEKCTELTKPSEELRDMAASMGRVFADFLAPAGAGRLESWLERGLGWMLPRLDVKETPREIVVTADLPGVDKDDIRVDLSEDRLTLRASRRHEAGSRDGGAVSVERGYGSFCRSFTLPAPVCASEAKADYRNGVLKITLPKARETRVYRVNVG